MAKLKTFTTEQGFFELAVAAPSRAAALRAWGIKHDPFAHGLARQTRDRRVIEAAEAKPGTVLRRPLNSKGPFRIDVELPEVRLGRRKGKSGQKRHKDEREQANQALDELNKNYRRRLDGLHKALAEVQNQIRKVSREWKDRRKQFTVLRPKARR